MEQALEEELLGKMTEARRLLEQVQIVVKSYLEDWYEQEGKQAEIEDWDFEDRLLEVEDDLAQALAQNTISPEWFHKFLEEHASTKRYLSSMDWEGNAGDAEADTAPSHS
jgi:hypothetical protein